MWGVPKVSTEDFMFQLTDEEYTDLESQIVISSWGGIRRAKPYAFTEQSVAMILSPMHYALCLLKWHHTGGSRREKGVSKHN